jgi:hypothetical protein
MGFTSEIPHGLAMETMPQTFRNRLAASLIQLACYASGGVVGLLVMRVASLQGWRPPTGTAAEP